MAGYLLLEHDCGAPAAVDDVAMDRWDHPVARLDRAVAVGEATARAPAWRRWRPWTARSPGTPP